MRLENVPHIRRNLVQLIFAVTLKASLAICRCGAPRASGGTRRRVSACPRLQPSFLDQGVRLTLSNTGPGIPRDDLEKRLVE
jgi:signal transduction histidine kinase